MWLAFLWSTLREYDIPLFASKHEALISSIFFARANRDHVQKMHCESKPDVDRIF